MSSTRERYLDPMSTSEYTLLRIYLLVNEEYTLIGSRVIDDVLLFKTPVS